MEIGISSLNVRQQKPFSSMLSTAQAIGTYPEYVSAQRVYEGGGKKEPKFLSTSKGGELFDKKVYTDPEGMGDEEAKKRGMGDWKKEKDGFYRTECHIGLPSSRTRSPEHVRQAKPFSSMSATKGAIGSYPSHLSPEIAYDLSRYKPERSIQTPPFKTPGCNHFVIHNPTVLFFNFFPFSITLPHFTYSRS
jgi:hypothetical protein